MILYHFQQAFHEKYPQFNEQTKIEFVYTSNSIPLPVIAQAQESFPPLSYEPAAGLLALLQRWRATIHQWLLNHAVQPGEKVKKSLRAPQWGMKVNYATASPNLSVYLS